MRELFHDCAFSIPGSIQVNLVPFGPLVDDDVLTDVDDSILGPYSLDTPIVFYGSPETEVFVSETVL